MKVKGMRTCMHFYVIFFWLKLLEVKLFCRLQGTKFKIIKDDQDQMEISFTKTWSISMNGSTVPLNVDKRYSFCSTTLFFF